MFCVYWQGLSVIIYSNLIQVLVTKSRRIHKGLVECEYWTRTHSANYISFKRYATIQQVCVLKFQHKRVTKLQTTKGCYQAKVNVQVYFGVQLLVAVDFFEIT